MAWANVDTPSVPDVTTIEPYRWDMAGAFWDVSGMTWDDNTSSWANIDTPTLPTWS